MNRNVVNYYFNCHLSVKKHIAEPLFQASLLSLKRKNRDKIVEIKRLRQKGLNLEFCFPILFFCFFEVMAELPNKVNVLLL